MSSWDLDFAFLPGIKWVPGRKLIIVCFMFVKGLRPCPYNRTVAFGWQTQYSEMCISFFKELVMVATFLDGNNGKMFVKDLNSNCCSGIRPKLEL